MIALSPSTQHAEMLSSSLLLTRAHAKTRAAVWSAHATTHDLIDTQEGPVSLRSVADVTTRISCMVTVP